jgi:hypothetical protein
MDKRNAVDIAVEFIEKINRRDFNGLAQIMAVQHRSVDEKGEAMTGRDNAAKMINEYISQWPDFQIHINDIYTKDSTVIIIGRTTGSCAETTRGTEIRSKLIYMLKIEGESVIEFKYAIKDTEENRKTLGMDTAEKITN